MDFKQLNDSLPYVVGGKKHILEYSPYNAVTLYFPGRHAKDTDPVGGDFVVTVDDERRQWVKHQFTHNDIFDDLEKKMAWNESETANFFVRYLSVVLGADPNTLVGHAYLPEMPGVHPSTFLYATQCLAVAEHRRYRMFEPKGGGRYLPVRFAAGIVAGAWTATDCANMQRRGRPGLEILEKTHNYDTLCLVKK